MIVLHSVNISTVGNGNSVHFYPVKPFGIKFVSSDTNAREVFPESNRTSAPRSIASHNAPCRRSVVIPWNTASW